MTTWDVFPVDIRIAFLRLRALKIVSESTQWFECTCPFGAARPEWWSLCLDEVVKGLSGVIVTPRVFNAYKDYIATHVNKSSSLFIFQVRIKTIMLCVLGRE